MFWGFTDAHSWIPGFRKGWGAALPLDDEYRLKPAYHAIREALRDTV
jgi:endo-1,4-beta-xylanase